MRMTFFETPAKFRAWLQKHHKTADELWVGFYKKATGKTSITWQEAVDEALCFGWIDGIRKKVDADSYTNRFTPRRRGSFWSAINTRRAAELIEEGRMRPAGRRAFDARDTARTAAHHAARDNPRFEKAHEREFKANRTAWAFFAAQPPGYRRMMIWFVVSARRDETRARRLQQLIALSAAKRRLEPMTPAAKKS
jgi:uncharacterized protein YdeI (YjbR/CyaY-like superfamily)